MGNRIVVGDGGVDNSTAGTMTGGRIVERRRMRDSSWWRRRCTLRRLNNKTSRKKGSFNDFLNHFLVSDVFVDVFKILRIFRKKCARQADSAHYFSILFIEDLKKGKNEQQR